MATYQRRDFLRLTGAAAATSLLASGCTNPAPDTATPTGDPIKVGLLLPEAGVYKGLGDDQRNGWDLFLKLNGNKLGGREVQVVTADEGEKPETAIESAKRLIREKVHVTCGIISSASLIEVQPMYTEAKIPLISTNASPAPVQGKAYGWRSSYVNEHPSVAFGEYVARTVKGKLSVVVADYPAGHDHVEALKKRFVPAGGKFAGDPILVPFPIGKNKLDKYLRKIEEQNPAGVYCFFAGADAVTFVKEYHKAGLAKRYQLHAPGWLTEGGALKGEGNTAIGILNSLNYSADLDNAANRTFVAEYTRAYETSPTAFSVQAYDAGLVLDKAVGAIGNDLSSERIEEELGNVGQVESPRGPWQFGKNRSPVQKWYLRRVQMDGDVLGNVVIDELATIGDADN